MISLGARMLELIFEAALTNIFEFTRNGTSLIVSVSKHKLTIFKVKKKEEEKRKDRKQLLRDIENEMNMRTFQRSEN